MRGNFTDNAARADFLTIQSTISALIFDHVMDFRSRDGSSTQLRFVNKDSKMMFLL